MLVQENLMQLPIGMILEKRDNPPPTACSLKIVGPQAEAHDNLAKHDIQFGPRHLSIARRFKGIGVATKCLMSPRLGKVLEIQDLA